jgi:hypothetical protein
MKILAKMLMLACLAVATGSAAQSATPEIAAPSSVDRIAPATQPLAGTLFFGRDQRDKMDRVRQLGAVAEVKDDDGVVVEPTVTVLNGFVKRSDGQTTIWVDGRPRYNAQGEGVRRLVPQDVGGSADTVRVLSQSLATPSSASSPKRVKRIPMKKALRKRVVAKP